jgi:hypothetical protein
MPLHLAHHPRPPALPPRQRPLWLKNNLHSQPLYLPTLCPTARHLACPLAPQPKEPCSQPLSLWWPSPPPTVGLRVPLTRQPSQDPGLLRVTHGPHRGACHPVLGILCPQLAPLAPGTPWWGAGPPVLVIPSSLPTSQQEENLLTQCSPSFQASQGSHSPRCPLSPHILLGPLPPMASHHLLGLPGLGISPGPGLWSLPPSTCATASGPPITEIRGSIGSGVSAPCGFVLAHRGLGAPGQERAGPEKP